MKAEAQIKLATLVQVVIAFKKSLRQTLWTQYDNLLSEFPDDQEEIRKEYQEMCLHYGIDFFTEEYHDGNDIAEYVENNVPDVK